MAPAMDPVAQFDQWYHRYRPVVRTAIWRVSKGSVRTQDLPDLEQEVWSRVWATLRPGSRAAYDPARSAVTTWLYLIARSVCINRFDCNSREPVNTAIPLGGRRPETRDQRFEARAQGADALRAFRTYAARAADGASLLAFLDAADRVGVVTPRRMARALDLPVPTAERLHARVRHVLTTLGVA